MKWVSLRDRSRARGKELGVVESPSWSRTLIQAEISPQLLHGQLWKCIWMFMVPRGGSLLNEPLNLPPALAAGNSSSRMHFKI